MSYRAAAIVSRLVTATPSRAHGAHPGQDNRCVSSIFAMPEAMPYDPVRVE